ncbi:hypothetical protein [Planctomycetes bacterium TBK1r]|uniref:hypothetical protein n=1 Tax=Stieleria magnilauensis TaxID=2527963 RepID=UPI0011A9D315
MWNRYLLPTNQIAGGVPIPDNAFTFYRVVACDETYTGVDDVTDEFVNLSRQDVLCYRLDSKRLVRDLGSALPFVPCVETIARVPQALRFGTYEAERGCTFPVYFLPDQSDRLLRQVVAMLKLESAGPMIVMQPERCQVLQSTSEWMSGNDVLLLSLAETFSITPRKSFAVTVSAVAKIDAFRQRYAPNIDATRPDICFPTPTGAGWADLRIKFVDGETVSIHLGETKGVYIYAQLGLVDARNGRPTKQWELLKSFADGRGLLTWKSADACRRNKKRKEYLSANLRDFFRIPGDPIVLTDDKKGWRTAFATEPER